MYEQSRPDLVKNANTGHHRSNDNNKVEDDGNNSSSYSGDEEKIIKSGTDNHQVRNQAHHHSEEGHDERDGDCHDCHEAYPHNYDFTKPTCQVYASDTKEIKGLFASSRSKMDYDYHPYYQQPRRILQDRIVVRMMKEQVRRTRDAIANNPNLSKANKWIVFTAGAMGSGKGYTMRWLDSEDLFPLNAFVWVDPDEIRTKLPEWTGYVESDPTKAARLTNKETGMIAEILVQETLRRGQNVLVDGTMRDHEWYRASFNKFRKHFPGHKIGIVHITAPLDVIKDRVKKRACHTGRVVPEDAICQSFTHVPTSVEKLSPLVDFTATIKNDKDGAPILLQPDSWDLFREQWFRAEDQDE